MKIKSGINWTRSAIAFTLLCTVFSFSLIAQDAVKVDPEAAAALVQRITDGLPDLIENEEQVTAIVEKWEARQALSGKTKSQILNLLFADVKSVVKDKERQDSIWTGLNETVSGDTETDELDDKAGKQPDAPVERSAPVPLQPARPVTREITEPNIEVQRLGSYVDGPWTVIGAYFATSYEPAPVCVRPPGSRLTNGACIKAQELKIPAGSPPEYLCESKEGKGNCRLYGSVWIPKTCNYGYRYFLWRRTASGAEGTMPMGNSLICTSGTTPVPGEVFVTGQFSGSLSIDKGDDDTVLKETENGEGDGGVGGVALIFSGHTGKEHLGNGYCSFNHSYVANSLLFGGGVQGNARAK